MEAWGYGGMEAWRLGGREGGNYLIGSPEPPPARLKSFSLAGETRNPEFGIRNSESGTWNYFINFSTVKRSSGSPWSNLTSDMLMVVEDFFFRSDMVTSSAFQYLPILEYL